MYSALTESGESVRFGISNENSFSVPKEFVDSLYIPKSKIKWEVESLTESDVAKVLGRYPGAFVKKPKAGIYTGVMCQVAYI